MAGTTYHWLQARDQRDEAQAAALRANDAAVRADIAATRAAAARSAESATRLEAQRLAARTALTQGRSLADRGAVDQGMLWMATALQQTPTGDDAFEQVVRLNLAAYKDFLVRSTEILPDEPEPRSVQFAANNSIFVTTHSTKVLHPSLPGERVSLSRVWDGLTGRPSYGEIGGEGRLSLTADGRTAALIRTDGSILYKDLATGNQLFLTPCSEGLGTIQVNFSPDGTLAAESGWGPPGVYPRGRLRLKDVRSGQQIGQTLDFETQVVVVDFRPDGGALAVSCLGSSISLWEIGREIKLLCPPQPISSGYVAPLAFNRSGRLLASCWTEKGLASVRYWDTKNGQLIDRRITLGDQPAYALAYSPDGRFLVTAERGGILRCWDALTDRPIPFPSIRIPDGSNVSFHGRGAGLLVVPDQLLARSVGAVERPGRARLFALPEGLDLSYATESGLDNSEILFSDRRAKANTSVAIGPNGERLIAAGWSAARILDLDKGLPVAEPIRNRWQASGPVAISRDGSIVAAVSNNVAPQRPSTTDCQVEVYEVASGRRRCPPLHPFNSVLALAISPDGQIIATGDFSNLLQLWHTVTGSPIGPPMRQENIVALVEFSPDGRKIAVGTLNERTEGHAGIRIWDIASRTPIGPSARHSGMGYPEQIKWLSDGSAIITLDRIAGSIMRIDSRTGAVTASANDFSDSPTAMTASPDCQTLLVGTSGGFLELRDAMSLGRIGAEMKTFDFARSQERVQTLAFAPDGRTAAAGYIDGSVRLWDIRTHLPIGPPRRHARSLIALTFRDQGHILSSLAADGEVRSWALRAPLEEKAEGLVNHLELQTGLRIGPNQDLTVITPMEIERRKRESGMSLADRTAIPRVDFDLKRHERIARFAEYQALWDTALYHLDHLIAAHATDGRLRVRRALALAARNQFTEAVREWARALSNGPKDACVDLVIQRATDARDAVRLAQAEWSMSKAIEVRPDDWRLYADRSEVRDRRGDVIGRDRDRRLAVEHGADSLYLVRLAEITDSNNQVGGWPEELVRLAEARLQVSDNPYALKRIAAHAAREGRLTRAADLLGMANQSVSGPILTMDYNRAVVAVARGDVATYRSLCCKLLDKVQDRSSPEVMNIVAWICSLGPSSDRPSEVVEIATKAMERSPASARRDLLITLGAAHIRNGKPREGIERIEEGLHLSGNAPGSHERALLAMAHLALGNADTAASWLTKSDSSKISDEDYLEGQLLLNEAVTKVFDPGFPIEPFAGPTEPVAVDGQAHP